MFAAVPVMSFVHFISCMFHFIIIFTSSSHLHLTYRPHFFINFPCCHSYMCALCIMSLWMRSIVLVLSGSNPIPHLWKCTCCFTGQRKFLHIHLLWAVTYKFRIKTQIPIKMEFHDRLPIRNKIHNAMLQTLVLN